MPHVRENVRIQETPKQKMGVALFEERIQRLEQQGKTEELELAQQEYALFLWEHDVTGALKANRFGKDLMGIFQEAELVRSPDGLPRANEDVLRAAHLVQVNMGELDRLNSSGDHALGDVALERTFVRCQQSALALLRQEFPDQDEAQLFAKFDIYRTAGNDFTILLRDTPAHVAQAVQKELSRAMPIQDIRPDQDDVPMAASVLSSIEALQHLEALDGFPEQAGLSEETAAVQFLREKLQAVNDFDKVRTRGERIAQKIRDARNGSVPMAAAEELYEKFLKKDVGLLVRQEGEAELPDFPSFQNRLEAAGAFDVHPLQWKKRVYEGARDEALRLLRLRSGEREVLSQALVASAIDAIEDRSREAELGQLAGPRLEGISTKKMREIGPASEQAKRQFMERLEVLGKSEGQLSLQRLRDRVAQTAEAPPGSIERRLAETELALEENKRDPLTGLYTRGMYFLQLEASLEHDRPMTVISVDMAFLKFFDREGGTATGDLAIETAGRILDAAKREYRLTKGIDVEAYRVGGDEFALRAQSADPDVARELAAIVQRMAQEEMGEIPAQAGAAETYHPEALQFNFGAQAYSSWDDIREQFAGLGLPLSLFPEQGAEERRHLADELTHIADARIESEKSLNRMAFLLGRSLETDQAQDGLAGERKKQLDVLSTYSEKAIFGTEGKAALSEWTADIQAGRRTISQVISEDLPAFVTEQLRKKGKEDVVFEKTSLERLEMDLQLTFLRRRMEEMEQDMQSLVEAYGEAHEQVQSQRQHVADMEAQLSEIVSMRERIGRLSS